MNSPGGLTAVLDDSIEAVERAARSHRTELKLEEYGEVTYVGHGVARVKGLPGIRSEEVRQQVRVVRRCENRWRDLPAHG